MATLINGYSDVVARGVQNQLFAKEIFPMQTELFCALYIVTPYTDGSGGIEVTGLGYVRSLITTTSWDFARTEGASSITTTTNINPIVFPPALGVGWGLVTGFGLLTAPVLGTLYLGGHLDSSILIGANTIPVFLPLSLKIQTANSMF